MRNNKILSAAIMAALAGAGASPFANAGNNECGQPLPLPGGSITGSCTLIRATPPGTAVVPWGETSPTKLSSTAPLAEGAVGSPVATEIIGDGWLASMDGTGASKTLTSVYCLGGKTGSDISSDFYVVYTLANAKFVLSSDTNTIGGSIPDATILPANKGVKATDFRANLARSSLGNAASQTSVSFAYVSPDQTSVKFYVQSKTTTKVQEGDTLYFSFDIKDFASALASEGGEVKLTTSFVKDNGEVLNIAPECAKTITRSQNALKGQIVNKTAWASAGDDDSIYIDVSTGNSRFTANDDRLDKDISAADATTTPATPAGCYAVLGSLSLTPSSSTAYGNTLDSPYAPVMGTGKFTVTNAPLNAKGSTICLDLSGDRKCTFTSSDGAVIGVDAPKAKPSVSGETSVEFPLDPNEAGALLAGTVNVLIGVDCDNTTAIKPLDGPATATLTLNYTDAVAGGNKGLKYTGTLKQVKRNGSQCTLFNVPGPDTKDEANIRVTNASTKAAALLGIMVDMDGSPVIGTSQEPVQLKAEADFAGQQTVRLSAADLQKLANGKTWRRGTLYLISGASKMEAFNLLREKVDGGAPLQNMSVGASGDGCD